MEIKNNYCSLCPRNCNRKRVYSYGKGVCNMGYTPFVSLAKKHYGEEPCISGENGSGAVFFAGCNLHCVFCQNHMISSAHPDTSKKVTIKELRNIYHRLYEDGAENINLVTPSHFVKAIAKSIDRNLPIPYLYNSSGYDSVESLRMLDGKIDIYMPDLKYLLKEPALKYSKAPDYPEVAIAAIEEMYRQVGPVEFSENGMLKKGLLIRHLVLPNNIENTLGVIRYLSNRFPNNEILFSLMSQYTPPKGLSLPEEISRTLTNEEYDTVLDELYDSNLENGYVQDLSSATEDERPDFNLSGL